VTQQRFPRTANAGTPACAYPGPSIGVTINTSCSSPHSDEGGANTHSYRITHEKYRFLSERRYRINCY
jgi:hypothetical protein